jgi:U3 small nucleolar RNA-associated protein 23
MRHGRAKAARKTLQFFRLLIGLNPPYQVVMDGTFLVAMITQKVPLKERLDRTLQHQGFVLHVTRSSILELEKLYQLTKKEVFHQAYLWALSNADHVIEQNDIPSQNPASSTSTSSSPSSVQNSKTLDKPGKEIIEMIESKSKYMVCSQDESLLDRLRFLGIAPIIRLSRGVLLLENPSKSSHQRATTQEATKWSVAGTVQDYEKKLVDHVREQTRKERELSRRLANTKTHVRRVPRKAKAPNPLSCKTKSSNRKKLSTHDNRKSVSKSTNSE